MADIPSLKQKITDVEVNQDAELTTSLHTNFGQAINYLLDETASQSSRITTQQNFQAHGQSSAINILDFYRVASNNTAVVTSNSITPQTSSVIVIVSGSVMRFNSDFDITIRRNAVGIKTLTVDQTIAPRTENFTGITIPPQTNLFQGGINLGFFSFIDTGATALASNTYDIFVNNTVDPGDRVDLHGTAIQLIARP